jgi:hypothetical protein
MRLDVKRRDRSHFSGSGLHEGKHVAPRSESADLVSAHPPPGQVHVWEGHEAASAGGPGTGIGSMMPCLASAATRSAGTPRSLTRWAACIFLQ